MAVGLKCIVIIVPVSEVLSPVRRVCRIGTCTHHSLESYHDGFSFWGFIGHFLFCHICCFYCFLFLLPHRPNLGDKGGVRIIKLKISNFDRINLLGCSS